MSRDLSHFYLESFAGLKAVDKTHNIGGDICPRFASRFSDCPDGRLAVCIDDELLPSVSILPVF